MILQILPRHVPRQVSDKDTFRIRSSSSSEAVLAPSEPSRSSRTRMLRPSISVSLSSLMARFAGGFVSTIPAPRLSVSSLQHISMYNISHGTHMIFELLPRRLPGRFPTLSWCPKTNLWANFLSYGESSSSRVSFTSHGTSTFFFVTRRCAVSAERGIPICPFLNDFQFE